MNTDKYSGLKLIDNNDDLDEFLSTNTDKDDCFLIKLYDEDTKKQKNYHLLDKIVRDLDKFKKSGLKGVNLLIPYERLNRHEFMMICNFYKNAKSKNLFLNAYVNHRHIDEEEFFDETKQLSWSLKTIIKANLDIDRVCEFIKINQFSPLEALAFIHQYVTSLSQPHISQVAKHTWCERDQFFAGIYQKYPEVVCQGYSSLEKEIIDNLQMTGLSCEVIASKYFDRKICKYENHARCYIKVNDDKYEINQSCIDDATWDRAGKDGVNTYAYFAMNNKCFNPELNSRYIYQEPFFDTLNRKTFAREITDYNYYQAEYNKGPKNLNQHIVEKIFFNVLQKINKTSSIDEILIQLKNMTASSYKDTCKQGYKSYITSESLQLTTKEAKEIYEQNLNFFKKQREYVKRNRGPIDTFINSFEKENLKEMSF